MNMDLDLVNRSLYFSGMLNEKEGKGLGLLTKEDKDSARPERRELYELCKVNYLTTFLEVVSEVPWTMGRKRKRMLKTQLPHGDTKYRFVYDLPYDCARPLELSGRGDYHIEGNFLATDVEKAELLYVTNGKILPHSIVFESVSPADLAEGKVDLLLSGGSVDEMDIAPDFTSCVDLSSFHWHGVRGYTDEEGVFHKTEDALFPEGYDPENEDYVCPDMDVEVPDSDYPDYAPPQFEPKFYAYWEMLLASKLAVKNTVQPRLHDTLLQRAMLVKQEAIASTRSIAKAKEQPSEWWADQLGLGGVRR